MGQQQRHLRTDGTWSRSRRNLLLCWAPTVGGKWDFLHFLHPSFSSPAHIPAFHNDQGPDGRVALKWKWCKVGSMPLLFLPFPHKGLLTSLPSDSCLEKLIKAGIASHSKPFPGSALPARHGKGWLGFGRGVHELPEIPRMAVLGLPHGLTHTQVIPSHFWAFQQFILLAIINSERYFQLLFT